MIEREDQINRKETLDNLKATKIDNITDKSKFLLNTDTNEKIKEWFYGRITELGEESKEILLEKMEENDIILTIDSLRFLIDIFQSKEVAECITSNESFIMLQDLILEHELIETYADNVTEKGYLLLTKLFPFIEENE